MERFTKIGKIIEINNKYWKIWIIDFVILHENALFNSEDFHCDIYNNYYKSGDFIEFTCGQCDCKRHQGMDNLVIFEMKKAICDTIVGKIKKHAIKGSKKCYHTINHPHNGSKYIYNMGNNFDLDGLMDGTVVAKYYAMDPFCIECMDKESRDVPRHNCKLQYPIYITDINYSKENSNKISSEVYVVESVIKCNEDITISSDTEQSTNDFTNHKNKTKSRKYQISNNKINNDSDSDSEYIIKKHHKKSKGQFDNKLYFNDLKYNNNNSFSGSTPTGTNELRKSDKSNNYMLATELIQRDICGKNTHNSDEKINQIKINFLKNKKHYTIFLIFSRLALIFFIIIQIIYVSGIVSPISLVNWAFIK
jgi:hypothetical protein